MIGADVRHLEWDERTRGTARYTADIPAEGMLEARVLRSPHPHARILDIDTRAALAAPGVAAVLTAADLPDERYQDYGVSDRPPLARDLVRHIGQEVAVVAAETSEQAGSALELIRIRYRPLPAVLDPAAALRPGAPLVHEPQGNVVKSYDRRFGDPEEGRRAAAHLHRARYGFGMQAHACMEPHTALASYDAGERMLHLWAPTQAARNIQREVARMLGLELEQVRLHRVAVGGDFGSRVRVSDIEVLAGALAMRTGRPVRLALDRAEEFAQTKHRHGFAIELETGVAADGTLLFRDADVLVESGSYAHAGPNELNYCTLLLGAQHRLMGAHVRGQAVYTNRRPGGSFRGAGGPQAVFAIESQLDELAGRLGMDPIELRLRNLNRPGDTTLTGWRIGTAAIAECVAAVSKALDWDAARMRGGQGRGVGIAVALHVSGAIVAPGTSRAEAEVRIGPDGRVRLSSGSSDPGTGQSTLIAQICAAELGVRLDRVDVATMDTATTPYDPGAGSSRGTYVTGMAVREASRAAADGLRELAAGKLGVDPGDVTLDDGYAVAGADRLPIGDLAALSFGEHGPGLSIHREHVAEIPLAAADGPADLSPSYAFAAHGVEVDVDSETGRVRVLRVVAAHDSGTVINPVSARGQVVGGVVMALGAALGEELAFEGGRAVNPSYVDYAMPRAADAPPVEVIFVGEPSPRGPSGAKGLAEIAMMPTAAAVANAVAHATGVRVRQLPITSDAILDGLHGRARHGRPLWRRPDRWWIAAVRWAYPRGLHALLHRRATRRGHGIPAAPAIEALVRPRGTAAAVAALAGCPDASAIGGGTDLLVQRSQGLAAPRVLVDLTSCADLPRLAPDCDGDLRIAATTTLANLVRSLEGSQWPGDRVLAETTRTIASAQIRESATVGGNVCQAKRCWFYRNGFPCYKRGGAASPCYAVLGDHRFHHAILGAHRCQAVTPSDLATILVALGGRVRLLGPVGARELPIGSFYKGPGETALRGGEIVTELVVPAAARRAASAFEKLGRYEGDFAIVSAAAALRTGEDGRIAGCRVVLGGVAPVPYRARAVERLLTGRDRAGVRPEEITAAARAWAGETHPLDGNAWKVDAAVALTARAITAALSAAAGR